MATQEKNLSEGEINRHVWIKGNFEGVLSGRQVETQGLNSTYHMKVVQANISNISKVSAPPTVLSNPAPITQLLVQHAKVQQGDQHFDADLHDFRLHEWTVDSTSVNHEKGMRSDRVIGIAYFFLKKPDVRNPLAVDQTKSDIPDRSPESPVETEGQEINCLACSYLLRLILALLVWFFCDLKLAVEFFSATLIPCWFSNFGFIKTRIKWILSGVLTAISAFGIWKLSKIDCGTIVLWPLILVASTVTLSFIVKDCKLRLLLTLMWFLAAMIFCGNKLGGCGLDKFSWLNPLNTELKVLADKIVNYNKPDPAEIKQALPADPNGGHRISINQALEHPELAKDCSNSIYFPEASLFDMNKSAIKPDADRSLNKLSLLLSKSPGATVKIVGHSDQVGNNTADGVVYNYQLSEQRARSVVEWLQQHNHTQEKFEVVGMGAQFPVFENPKDQSQLALNRRVEIELPCTPTNKK